MAVLLEAGADVNIADAEGSTPLHWAAEGNCLNATRVLLAHNAVVGTSSGGKVTHADELTGTCNKSGITPLHAAAAMDNVTFVDMLIAASADIHARDMRGNTPLHWVAKGGCHQSLVLLANRSTVDARNQEGNDPLLLAASVGAVDCVELLLRAGAQPNAKNPAGLTPLHVAAFGSKPPCVEALIRHGASVNVTDDLRRTPLHFALQSASTQSVALLLYNKANVSLADCNGKTALHYAVESGSLGCFHYVMKHGGSSGMAWSDTEGRTALHYAVQLQHADMINELLIADANMNQRDKFGMSPLQLAEAQRDDNVCGCHVLLWPHSSRYANCWSSPNNHSAVQVTCMLC